MITYSLNFAVLFSSTFLLTFTLSSVSLKEAADGLGLYVGTAINYGKYNKLDESSQQSYKSIDLENFSAMTAENKCKFTAMGSGPNVPGDVDTQICEGMKATAQKNEQAFRGHCLFWPSYDKYPSYSVWLRRVFWIVE